MCKRIEPFGCGVDGYSPPPTLAEGRGQGGAPGTRHGDVSSLEILLSDWAWKKDYYSGEGLPFMETTRTRLFSIAFGVTIACLQMGVSPLGAQEDCKVLEKVVANAFTQIHSIPTHVYTTTKINGQTFSSEVIYADGSMYMKMNGKWTRAGSIKEMEKVENQGPHPANSKDTCRFVKDEPMNGEMAAVYSSHSETPKGTIDLQMWVSKSKGLMLREDTDSSGAVMSSRYDYANVKAPQ
ncbi:MAG: hypothetical protein WA626_04830 [Acidobacteriaceae bacterium]